MPYITGIYTQAYGGGNRVNVGRLGRVIDVNAVTGPNGPQTATITLDRDPAFDTPALAVGRRIVFTGAGAPYWSGVIKEPDRADPWTITCNGLAIVAKDYLASNSTGNPYVDVDGTVNQQIARGLPWKPITPPLLNAGGTLQAAPSSATDLDQFLSDATLFGGPNHYVRADGTVLGYYAPTAPSYAISVPSDTGTFAAQDYANTLVADYLNVNDATRHFGDITATDPVSAAMFGPVTKAVDLTRIGLMYPSDAQRMINSLLPQVAPAFKLSSPITVPTEALRTLQGASVDPRFVEATAGILMRGAIVPSYVQSNPTAPYLFRLGEIAWSEQEQSVTLTPFGASTTDIGSLLAPEAFPPGFVV